ncbi:hypothetical protein JOC77_002006 [Peribacillus deserti]|uniref:Uncharacterized protein n=1 Tax=Peribacillus deserti TaxID=673318 RepID=A0ABS2QJW2_9BACI|nr:DUF6123 family protein [Peribacillus deserti]MBM7692576.1 hypothetical protein [Peribacillus deserti]
MKTVEDYLYDLEAKGFCFADDAIGFIYFGKHYTNASDTIVNIAIEITLKAQKGFDGSFYISLLESLVQNKITSKRRATNFAVERKLI